MTWEQDYTALLASYAYVFGVIALAELLRRAGHRPLEFTRKFVHIGVGMWVIGTVFLYLQGYGERGKGKSGNHLLPDCFRGRSLLFLAPTRPHGRQHDASYLG
jgi:hypothetical protein